MPRFRCSRPISAPPTTDVREGDLEALPFADASCEGVAVVSSSFDAADMPAAMHELAWVVRPASRVVITAWGRQSGARC